MNSINNTVEQMTQAHLRNVQQLAVFYTGHDKIYAINIAKIKAFVITQETKITELPKDTNMVSGIATIRGEAVTLLNLDAWLGFEPLQLKDYKLILFCELNNKNIGFLIKDVVDIVEKKTHELVNTLEKNSKITYTTYVKVDDKDELCAIFNAEQFLKDIDLTYSNDDESIKYGDEKIQSNKLILAAEDSQVAREMLINFFEQIQIKYEVYENGELLINRLDELNPNDIGLVITDIEMPLADGYQVASYIKHNNNLSHIPVIINSSMTSNGVKSKMNKIGIDGFVGKNEISNLYELIKKFILK